MRRRMVCAVLLLMATMVVHAQHALDGVWEGQTQSGSAIVLTLQVKDSTLTGTLARNGEPVPIVDGVVTKQQFTFKATVNGQTESVSGELAADEIKAWLDRQGPESAITLTRAKAK
jgi:hypothetical protein